MVDKHAPGGGLRRLMGLVALRPRTAEQLHRFVTHALGVEVGRVAVGADSSAPFDYLCHAFFERGDCVVWASRGGGKTMLGAVATLLDLVFKPGIEVRILGGSLEQAAKMHGYLLALLERPAMRGITEGAPTRRAVRLKHGSVVEVLAASQRSVRGVRVHKLRVDEVEELDPRLWEAAQLVTRSGVCGGVEVRGSVEALSTMHRPGGVMARLVSGGGRAAHHAGGDALGEVPPAGPGASAMRGGGEAAFTGGAGARGRPAAAVFRWNALDVAARCEPRRACARCNLWDDCRGRAKQAGGFVPVSDLVRQRARISDRAWAAEMMCRRPRLADAVYEQFDEAVHVMEEQAPREAETQGGPASGKEDAPDADAPATTGLGTRAPSAAPTYWVAGMDFGLRSPTVLLWARVRGEGEAAVVHVLGEYGRRGRTLPAHLRAINDHAQARGLARLDALAWIAVDPAGRQRNAQTGRSDVALLRRWGARVRARGSRIVDGIEIVRRRLDRRTLRIHPCCASLIEALAGYHFDPDDAAREAPVKDGPDHWCDALRYLLVHLERGGDRVEVRAW